MSRTSSSVPEIRNEQFFSLGYSRQSINLRVSRVGVADMIKHSFAVRDFCGGILADGSLTVELRDAKACRHFDGTDRLISAPSSYEFQFSRPVLRVRIPLHSIEDSTFEPLL